MSLVMQNWVLCRMWPAQLQISLQPDCAFWSGQEPPCLLMRFQNFVRLYSGQCSSLLRVWRLFTHSVSVIYSDSIHILLFQYMSVCLVFCWRQKYPKEIEHCKKYKPCLLTSFYRNIQHSKFYKNKIMLYISHYKTILCFT